MSKGKLAILLILAVAAATFAYSCYLSPKAQVKRAVTGAIDALEHENIDAVMDFISPEFTDAIGLSRDDWRKLIEYSWSQWKDITVRLIQPEITVAGDTATVKFHVMAEATRAASLGQPGLPARETYYRRDIEFQLVRTDRWRLRGMGELSAAEWEVPVDEVLK